MKKKPPKGTKTKPTLRQRKFVKGVVQGKSAAQAARDAGYADSTARWAESKIIARFWIAGLVMALFALTTLKLR